MTKAPTNAASAEVTAIDTAARGPLLWLLGSGLVWLLVSGILALITSIQLHTPTFLADCGWFTHGRAQAMRESVFVYGWLANAGLATATWVLGRLGGYPLRALNWAVVGCIFWNAAIAAGLVGIATGDMTTFALIQLPRYVQPLLVVAYSAMAISGVLAWSGRKTDGTYAAQWYAAAALFLLPWALCAAQAVLFWFPVRGVVQAVAAGWFGQVVFSLWLSPLVLAGVYYVVPKITGRALPSYVAAPLAFWTLIVVGAWNGGRHLIGGPVPAWVPTMAVVGGSLLLFHFLVVAMNLRFILGASGTAANFLRFGLVAYVVNGLLEFFTSFRGIAVETQFTFIASALEHFGLYGGLSMMLFATIYYMVPRLTGAPWASAALTMGHLALVAIGVLLATVALLFAGFAQGSGLLSPAVSFAEIFSRVRVPLLLNSAAQLVLLAANLLLFVNFVRSACAACCSKADATAASGVFRQPSTLEASAS